MAGDAPADDAVDTNAISIRCIGGREVFHPLFEDHPRRMLLLSKQVGQLIHIGYQRYVATTGAIPRLQHHREVQDSAEPRNLVPIGRFSDFRELRYGHAGSLEYSALQQFVSE
jgi:hypothetical protein